MRQVNLRAVLMALVGVMLLSAGARAGCRDQGCQMASKVERDDEDVWRQHPGDPLYFGIYRNGRQIAGYDIRTGEYRKYEAMSGTWSKPKRPPWKKEYCACVPECHCDEECLCASHRCTDECTCVARAQIPNYGVDLSKLNGNQDEVITLNGRRIPRREVDELLLGEQMKDDSGKLRLTIIGSEEKRKQVLDDLSQPPLSDLKEQLLVQAYAPNHWTITRSGFYSAGQPTIYVQDATGKVLHRQDDYEGGATALAGAIRRADPNYDPKKDPDLRKLFRLPNALSQIPAAAWLLGAGILFGLLKKGQP